MFIDVIEMIYDSFKDVISAFDVTLFWLANAQISFWDIILSMLTLSIVFGFFLRQRGGSVLATVSNENKKANAEYREAQRQSNRKGGKKGK